MREHRKLISKWLLVLIGIIMITAMIPFLCFATDEAAKTVRVAYVLSPGYQEGGEGEYKTGYGYEYLQKIAVINNWKYEYIYGSFNELLNKLENGEVDLMGNLSYTEERAKSIDYGTYEQGKENYYLYVKDDREDIDISDYSTLDGKKIGVSAGSYQEAAWKEWCTKHNVTTEIVQFSKYTERYAALNSGEIDAMLGGIVRQEEDTSDWKMLVNVASSPFYFGVSKKRPDILAEINAAQKWILEENPFYNEEIFDRYMRALSLTTTTLDKEEKTWLQQQDGSIKVGYLEGFQPISYQDENGSIKGIAADALQSIEKQYEKDGLSFEAVSYKNYNDMLTALKKGDISAMWPVYMDYWNADQKGFVLTKQVMNASVMLVFHGEYTEKAVDRIGVAKNGSLTKVYASIHYPESTLIEFESYQDAMDAVDDGTIDSILYETSIFHVDETKNVKLRTFSSLTFQEYFGITFAVSPQNKYLASILDKGITVFGDAGANRALITNSVIEKELSIREYLEQNPLILSALIAVVMLFVAAALIFVTYSRMSFRVKASQKEKEIYEKLSNSDPLTGLYNRKAVFSECNKLLKKYPDKQFVIFHIDMVHFRLYNTFFGDKAGDRLLCDIAELLQNIAEDYDCCAYGRIEADVFCLCSPYDKKLYDKHMTCALKYLKEYRSDFLIVPKIGMYFVTDREMPIEAMFTRAALAAKEVQSQTPNATVVYDESLEKGLNEKQQVINDMQAAIEFEQFKVYLQPKYSLKTNKMVGAEALVRWYHPTKGVVSPGIFIPVFESNGFITTLDRYMWEHVCQLLSKWKKEFRPMVPVSVNVSRLSMFGSTTVDFLKELVKKYDIEPEYLELELTESAYMDDPEEMKAQMHALKAAGFTILLDDFGSGYSSLNTLREIPVDILKLDMKFLSLDQTDIRGGIVISSVIRMAKLLKLRVVAEGVENQEQADYLKSVGCEYVQGYLFSRPLPAADYEKLLTDSSQPLMNVNQPVIDHIGKIIAETGSATYAMGTVIPIPLSYLEYANHQFTFLRVNPAFHTEFNDIESSDSITEVFARSLTGSSCADFVRTIEESIQSGKEVRTLITRNAASGKKQRYICLIMYEGNTGVADAIVATFINVTEFIQ